jgi:hypothetical protein
MGGEDRHSTERDTKGSPILEEMKELHRVIALVTGMAFHRGLDPAVENLQAQIDAFGLTTSPSACETAAIMNRARNHRRRFD